MAAEALHWMGVHFGVDVLQDGMFKAPGAGVRVEEYMPVKSITQYLRENDYSPEETADFIQKYAQPDSVKKGEAKTKKKQATKYDKAKAGGAAAGGASGSKTTVLTTMPMRNAAKDAAQKRDLNAFLDAAREDATPTDSDAPTERRTRRPSARRPRARRSTPLSSRSSSGSSALTPRRSTTRRWRTTRSRSRSSPPRTSRPRRRR
jgi:hypothetical protein